MKKKESILAKLNSDNIDFITKFSTMIDYARVNSNKDVSLAEVKLNQLIEWINDDDALKIKISHDFKEWFLSSKISLAFVQLGIGSKVGLMGELGNKIRNKILPPPPSQDNFNNMLFMIFNKKRDSAWISDINPLVWEKLYRSIIIPDFNVSSYFLDELMYAMEILSTQIAAEELDEELIRLDADRLSHDSPFVALHREVIGSVDKIRVQIKSELEWVYDKSHFDVLLEQCQVQLSSLKKKSVNRGISVSLTYRFERMEQIFKRLEYLSNILEAIAKSSVSARLIDILKDSMAFAANKHSFREVLRQNFRILSLSITNNSSNHGEHYIVNDYRGYLSMLKSAGGAGVIIAFMAINKVYISTFDLTEFFHMILVSLNYGLGFVLIHLLGFTVATKQPAMTASTIASSIKNEKSKKAKLEEIAELFATVSRSQLAAIIGNVTIAMSVAMFVSLGYFLYTDSTIFSVEKANKYLKELEPFKALFFAAIAGVWLFLSGLISGYFDNRADYLQLRERYYHHPFLVKIFKSNFRKKFANYMHENHGSIMGNFLFGVLLGVTPFIGYIFQVDLEIRHIAFSSANLGYCFSSISMDVMEFLLYLSFVLLIGLVNLSVSFLLALNIALKSKDADIGGIFTLFYVVIKRFIRKPRDFFIPQKLANSSKEE